MKKSVYQHCTSCQVCAKHNIKTQQLKNEHFSSPPQPMEFIAMDLIGEFHPASSKGNRFALTAVCMLTGFTFCIPLKSKCAEDVIKAYIDHICCTFGPSRKILTDNGTEFKNKLWTEVFEKLRIEQKFTPIYKARHAHKRLYMVLPKYSKIQVLPGITSCRLVKDNKQAIELNSLLLNNMPKDGYG